jgi:pimeloyl-ACP methyl ester carboxylesterase
MLVIRGGNSDILSADTLAAMAVRHPGMETIDVPGQGHVPLLEGDEIVSRVVRFVTACDGKQIAAGGTAS